MIKKTLPFVVVVLLTGAPAWGWYNAVDVKDGGVVTGKVKVAGPVPRDGTIAVTKDQRRCGNTLPEEKYVINAAGEVKNAVVLIEGIKAGKPAPKTKIRIDNKKCSFEPHVQVGVAGQDLVLRNDDSVLHNTHLYDHNMTIFDANLPRQGMEFTRTILRLGLITLHCDAHSWMTGYLYVSENPYIAVTDAQGDFSLTDVPPGDYTLRIWHEALGEQAKKITVLPNGRLAVPVDFTR